MTKSVLDDQGNNEHEDSEQIAKIGPIEVRGKRRERPEEFETFDEAWAEFRDAVIEASRIRDILDWLTPRLDRVSDWLARLEHPEDRMEKVMWAALIGMVILAAIALYIAINAQ